jgi:hypothetical protein
MNHDKESVSSEASSMILALPQSLKGNENNLDLSLQNKMVSNCDETHGSNGIDATQIVYVDLVDSQVHTCAEILQVDNQCSIIHDLFHTLVWFIYMILCTHISDIFHANKCDNVQMNTHDEFFAKISHPLCVGYVMFDKCVEINNILENVFRISSMKSLDTTYSASLHSI